jgi:hypothetical protein
MAVRSAMLRKIVEGVLTDLMIRTNTDNVQLADGSTLSTFLAGIITQENITDYVDARINHVLNVNPGLIDLLNDIQQALEDKGEVVEEILNTLATKATKEELAEVSTAVGSLSTALGALTTRVTSLESAVNNHGGRLSAVESLVGNLADPEILPGLSRVISGTTVPSDLRNVDLMIHLLD